MAIGDRNCSSQLICALASSICLLVSSHNSASLLRNQFVAGSSILRTGGLHGTSQLLQNVGGPAFLGRLLAQSSSGTVWTARSWQNTMSISTNDTRGLLPRPLEVNGAGIVSDTDSFIFVFFSLGCSEMAPIFSTLAQGVLSTRAPPYNTLPSAEPFSSIESYNSLSKGSHSRGVWDTPAWGVVGVSCDNPLNAVKPCATTGTRGWCWASRQGLLPLITPFTGWDIHQGLVVEDGNDRLAWSTKAVRSASSSASSSSYHHGVS